MRQESGRFRVIYCPEDVGVIPDLWETIHTRLPQVERQLGLALADTVRFVITPSQAEWFRVTAGAPIWANGIAFAKQGAAVLKSPRFGLPYGPLPVTAVHEYVHLLLEAGAPQSGYPRWFDEGIAQLLAGQMSYLETALLSRAALMGRVHTLWQLESLMSFSEGDARQGYAESLVAVELLRNRFGMSGLSNLVHSVRQGRDFEDAFANIFNIKLGEFESDYLRHVQETYKYSIFGDTDLWVSALFIILVLAAGFYAWRRRKKTLAKWQKEEEPKAEEESELHPPPYIINYTVVRRGSDEEEERGKPES